jgi:single-stranded DNA-specific DHH superfamily exonuclease
VIVLGSRSWHHGVVGIVASRLMRQYHKPTFIVAIDEDGIGKGSGRSIDGVSLVEALRCLRGGPDGGRRTCDGGRTFDRGGQDSTVSAKISPNMCWNPHQRGAAAAEVDV